MPNTGHTHTVKIQNKAGRHKQHQTITTGEAELFPARGGVLAPQILLFSQGREGVSVLGP